MSMLLGVDKNKMIDSLPGLGVSAVDALDLDHPAHDTNRGNMSTHFGSSPDLMQQQKQQALDVETQNMQQIDQQINEQLFDLSNTEDTHTQTRYINQLLLEHNILDVFESHSQQVMWDGVGIIREETGLKRAGQELQMLLTKVEELLETESLRDATDLKNLLRLRNLLETSKAVQEQARRNKKSCGGHYRSDDVSAASDDEE